MKAVQMVAQKVLMMAAQMVQSLVGHLDIPAVASTVGLKAISKAGQRDDETAD